MPISRESLQARSGNFGAHGRRRPKRHPDDHRHLGGQICLGQSRKHVTTDCVRCGPFLPRRASVGGTGGQFANAQKFEEVFTIPSISARIVIDSYSAPHIGPVARVITFSANLHRPAI